MQRLLLMFLLFTRDYAEAGSTNSTAESLENADQSSIGKIVNELKMSNHKESNLGNFITDSMVNAFKNETKMAVLQSKLININRVGKGKITSESFRNMSGLSFTLVTIPGEQLRDIFEESVSRFDEDENDQSGAFLQVSGMKLNFDLRQDNGSRLAYASLYCNSCDRRKDLNDDANYTLVTNTIQNARDGDSINAVTAIQDFLESFDNQTLPTYKYKKTQCRTWLITNYYKQREYLLYFLIAVMAVSGFLTLITNSVVISISVNARKKIFEKSNLSLAFVDILTGIICTPSVCLTYYYSRFTSSYSQLKHFLQSMLVAKTPCNFT